MLLGNDAIRFQPFDSIESLWTPRRIPGVLQIARIDQILKPYVIHQEVNRAFDIGEIRVMKVYQMISALSFSNLGQYIRVALYSKIIF